LEKKDKERQQVIKDSCSLGNVASLACQGALQEAWITKSQYDDDFNYIIKYRELYRHDAAALNEALNGLSKEEVQHLLAIEAIAKESGRNVTEVATQYRAIMDAHGITSSLAGTHYGIKGNKIVKNKPVAGEAKGEIQQSGKASETTINKATAEKGNKSSQFSEHAKNEQEIKAEKGTTRQITPNLPKTREKLYEDLKFKGFTSNGQSQGGYETWKGPDSVTVTIKPTGEVIRTQRVWKSDRSGKYSERQDYFGNRLPDQLHSTGHFVE
ncbi:DUF6862 domain-containing protein, partial [Candidatus Schmidhempelia bombi]|uniref:DUF6862 domain-containing protein n=1 Tax=Candidatus Schmidhempelia bombi TaxID=1505866 RepID=UPI0019311054